MDGAMDAADYLDRVISKQLELDRAKVAVEELIRDRDDMIYVANEDHGIPISTIASALGIRRDTVATSKLKAQTRYYMERSNASGAA